MKKSTNGIRTSHAGRLPTPPGCENMAFRLFRGEQVDPAVIDGGIDQVVGKQLDLGIDCIGDGEFWKVRNFAYFSRHFTGI
jgi:methionine synthase II (cobalamin-independent)